VSEAKALMVEKGQSQSSSWFLANFAWASGLASV
jgi:hypothetical protein